ncbi:phage tail sheath protein FI [Kibdelosporangium banguiense]|uniref:Phage tail sheath protein FI n=1 Tax=Kibdelosporangium banguiense TaxID=1365924 RepID=A0ABS4TQ68_9PSEU|nr:phage tail sheath subtilisin-like domain-containing protein [Kibdelosporangium banguiense]MBP2326548.1 phage tail sheath protein FI [Kibdelosporangium banguiense]
MASVSYPGVYVDEVSSGVRPIAAAGTSTAAFIGQAQKGSLTEAVKIFTFTEFQNLYGDFLSTSFLAHAVFQFFNNGGSQCYVARVAGANTAAANIVLKDRGTTAQASLTVEARSPGVWANTLALLISNGTNDPANEFNLSVSQQDQTTPAEVFANLSMVPGAPNFAETVTASSNLIRVTVNPSNTNVQAGTSRGAAAPLSLTGLPRTRLAINVNGDGYQEINLTTAVGAGAGQVPDLTTAANQAGAIQFVVRALTKLRTSTSTSAFTGFTCVVDSGVLLLRSGFAGPASSVWITDSANAAENATGLLRLGKANGGVETVGAAVTRPRVNPAGVPPANYYLIGDNAAPTADVLTVRAGSDGDPVLNDVPYIEAFQRFNRYDDVSLLAVPGIGSPVLVGEGVNYCARRSLSDCFFVGDMSQDDDTVPEAEAFMAAISPKNSYGAVYLPWIKMLDPSGLSSEPILVPPSGYVAGVYARSDAQRGVWRAPAGTSLGLGGTAGLAVDLTDVQQGNLNPKNINVIRNFAGAGIVLWGSRTISSDTEYNYVPVRRMAIFLRVSIYRGIQWAVFEPNDEPLWGQLRLNIRSFMTTLFRRGAFQGATASEAFFVKCDSETTTQADIDAGVVNVLVGFAPLKPAEFVVVRISQRAGQTA